MIEKIKEVLKTQDEIIVAYLYGSTAKKQDNKDSDIDIGILIDENFEPDALYTSNIANKIEKKTKTGREIDVRILNDKSIIFLHQVLKNGKEILSKNEKKRIEFETNVYDRYLDFKPYFEQYNKIRRERVLE